MAKKDLIYIPCPTCKDGTVRWEQPENPGHEAECPTCHGEKKIVFGEIISVEEE